MYHQKVSLAKLVGEGKPRRIDPESRRMAETKSLIAAVDNNDGSPPHIDRTQAHTARKLRRPPFHL